MTRATNSRDFFRVCEYKVTTARRQDGTSSVQAIVEVKVGSNPCIRRSATGVGPVHALDTALRLCLETEFPELEAVRLSDYKVVVVDAADGTGAQVRVVIEATDGDAHWEAGCSSANVIEASFEALCAATVLGLLRTRALNPTAAWA